MNRHFLSGRVWALGGFSADRRLGLLTLVVLILTLGGCGRPAGNLTLHFDHEVAGEPLEFDVVRYKSPAGYPYSVATLRYYISDVHLVRSGEEKQVFDIVHYRDARNDATRALTLGPVRNGVLDKVIITVGLNESRNLDGALPSTQENMNMEWPIPGDIGYHFMKFEGKFMLDGAARNFAIHTGATKRNLNYVRVEIPLDDFSVDGGDKDLAIVMDLNEWLQNPKNFDFVVDGSMIMGNQSAQETIKNNGYTAFKARPE